MSFGQSGQTFHPCRIQRVKVLLTKVPCSDVNILAKSAPTLLNQKTKIMAAICRPTQATYVVHDRVTAETSGELVIYRD